MLGVRTDIAGRQETVVQGLTGTVGSLEMQ